MDKGSDRLAEQAAMYFARRAGETLPQRREREAWLAEDARHARAYDEILQLWDHLGTLRDAPTLQALKTRDEAAVRRRRRFGTGFALAAAMLGLLLGGVYVVFHALMPPPVPFATGFGERRTETLADGTRAVLNTDTALVARYSPRRRAVDLQRGEAQFDVAHDARRPFVVAVGDSTVTALGTRFQVRRGTDGATVTLLDGTVEVARGQDRHVLQPNEQAQVSAGAGIRVHPIDPEVAGGWLDGWLRFRNAPLREVVAEANRYSARKLRLGDAALADVPLSGDFHAGDSASIASVASLTLPVRVDDSGADIVLLPQ